MTLISSEGHFYVGGVDNIDPRNICCREAIRHFCPIGLPHFSALYFANAAVALRFCSSEMLRAAFFLIVTAEGIAFRIIPHTVPSS